MLWNSVRYAVREEYLSKYVIILLQFFMNVPFVDGMNIQWRIMHMKN